MSKSLGNAISPHDIIEEFGADILRLWVASSDYRVDVRISHDIIAQMVEIYRKIRNTLRFMLGNLQDFDPRRHNVGTSDLADMDRWILRRLNEVIDRCTAAYDTYTYHLVYQAVHNFCTIDLSSFYLDVSKDRLYAEAPDSPSRRSVQSVLHHAADALTRIMAPILPFTAEDAWQHLPESGDRPDSVHLATWPETQSQWNADDLADTWGWLLQMRDEVARAVEQARSRGDLRDAAAAAVEISLSDPGVRAVATAHRGDLVQICRVAEVRVTDTPAADAVAGSELPGLQLNVEVTQYEKCARCWRHMPDVGDDPDHADLCRRCAHVMATLA